MLVAESDDASAGNARLFLDPSVGKMLIVDEAIWSSVAVAAVAHKASGYFLPPQSKLTLVFGAEANIG
jgi:hypothetical protein